MIRTVQQFCLLIIIMFGGLAAQADPVDYRYLDARIQLMMRRPDMMGLSVGVIENHQQRFLKGYGLTEENGNFVTADTVFRWASLSKGLAGSMAGELADEGQLSLDASLSAYQTSLRLPGFGETRASVRDLLAHRLGLETRALNRLLETGGRPSTIRAQMQSAKNICQIGTCYSYQNVAFDAITEIFERATGKSFATLAEERVFRPLGMTSATMTYAGLVEHKDYARPHSWSSGSDRLYKDGVTLPYFDIPSAAGVSSSVRDMTRFMMAQFGTRRDVFTPQGLKEVQSPMVATPRTTDRLSAIYPGVTESWYGLGWRIYTYRGHTLVGHEGVLRGTRATMLFDPELGTGIVVAWNSNVSRPVGLQFELFDMVYGEPKRDLMRLMSDKRG